MALQMQVLKLMRTRSVQMQAVMTRQILLKPRLAETADQRQPAFVLLQMDCSAGQGRRSGQMPNRRHLVQTVCRILLRLPIAMADQSRLKTGPLRTLHQKLIAVLMADQMLRVLRCCSLQTP